MEFTRVLEAFSGFFEREDIRYALAGGLALQAWGHTRTTHDADFVVPGAERERVIAYAESIGYRTTFMSEGYSNHRHPDPAFGDVDFLYVYGATAEQVFTESSPRNAVGVTVPVTKPEHLIAMKVRAMKNAPRRVLIDAPDIEFLLSLPNLDRARVRAYFDQHGLLKIYDELEKQR